MKARINAATIILVFLLATPALAAPVDAQQDTFDGGAVLGWQQGAENNAVGQASGGPDGAGDGYLQVSADGSGAGGRLTVFNDVDRWTGSWTSAKIVRLDIDLRNESTQTLQMRIKIEAAQVMYSPAVEVAASSGWATYSFDVSPASLEGTGDPLAVLGAVSRLRIEHNIAGSHPPPPVAAVIGIDNITAVADDGVCGDAVVDPYEVCDGSNLQGTTCADLPAYDDGELACGTNCTQFDTSGCTRCGDGLCAGNETETSCPADCATPACGDDVVSAGEACEPGDLQGESCVSLGFTGGTLACAADCLSFDTSACTTDDDDSGCSTAADSSAGGPLLLVLLLLPFVLRRRLRA